MGRVGKLETDLKRRGKGAKPASATSKCGGPSLFTPAQRLKTSTKMRVPAKGCRMLQSPPNRVCRYRIFMSRQIRNARSSRYKNASRKSKGCHPLRGFIKNSVVAIQLNSPG